MNPLTTPDCDLRNFEFMPLDVARLRDSDLAALNTAEEFRAAVLLWCASWHQVPAASLPDDDLMLSNFAGWGRAVKEWKKHRNGALHGWIKCSDGRLYHPVIAEKAMAALDSKYRQEWKTWMSAVRKHNQRHPDNQRQELDFDAWMSHRTSEVCPIGQDIPVQKTSNEKQPPTEKDTDTERDISVVSNTQGNCNTPSVTPSATVCIAIREVYDQHNHTPTDISQANPTLQALIAAGATTDEFRDAAYAAMQANPRKGFGWIIGRVKGQREQAAGVSDLTKPPIKGAINAREMGRNIAASSIFTPETTQHLRGNPQHQPTEIEVNSEKL